MCWLFYCWIGHLRKPGTALALWYEQIVKIFFISNKNAQNTFYFNNIYIIITPKCLHTFVSSSGISRFVHFPTLPSVYIIKSYENYPIEIFMWLLLIKCSLYDFTIQSVSVVRLRGHICNLDIPVLIVPVCWGGENWTVVDVGLHDVSSCDTG